MGRVEGKVALITGGGRGIGAETARLLVREGADLIVTDVLDDLGHALVESLGKRAVYRRLDVTSESDWALLTEWIFARYGRLDILVNNAGITGLDLGLGPQDPEHASLESWRRVHQINNEGVFLGCRFGISLMKQHGGSIINMSSRSGVVGIPHAAAYAASKAAVRNHSKTVALYCAEQGYRIRCNSIHPGAILTPIWEPMLGDNLGQRTQQLEAIAAGIPLGHMGEPADVAYLVLYLASDESKYMTGAEIMLDGGILAGSSASLSAKKN